MAANLAFYYANYSAKEGALVAGAPATGNGGRFIGGGGGGGTPERGGGGIPLIGGGGMPGGGAMGAAGGAGMLIEEELGTGGRRGGASWEG